MQQLQNASINPDDCARVVLDGVPAIFAFIRITACRQRAKGLSIQQFRALAVLHRWPGHSLSMLADYLGVSVPTVSRLIDSLVKKKMVNREIPAGDRRVVHLTSTAAGAKLYQQVVDWTRAELAERLKHLSRQKRQRIILAIKDLQEIFEP